MLAAVIRNGYRGKTERAFSAHDFFPYLKPKQKRQTAEDHAAIVRQLAARVGGELSTKYTRGEA